jgi:hypothetical protein
MSEAPMPESPMTPSGAPSFFQTWVDALTKPREETYAAIAASPKAKAMTGYLWVFLTAIVSSLITLLVQGSTIRNQLGQAGLDQQQFGTGFGAVAVTLLCGTPIFAVLGAVLFAIFTAIVQWIAKMFGGRGTNDQLAYTLAAISAPYALVSSVLVLLSAIPFVGLCFSVIAGLGGIYTLVLAIMAVKAVNQFGWGAAIGSYFIPGLAMFLLCCCLAAVVAAVSGAALGNVFSTLNQSLIP